MWKANPFVDVEYVMNSPSLRVMSVEFKGLRYLFDAVSGISSFPSIEVAAAKGFLGLEIVRMVWK